LLRVMVGRKVYCWVGWVFHSRRKFGETDSQVVENKRFIFLLTTGSELCFDGHGTAVCKEDV
jgi:hypothetical protein